MKLAAGETEQGVVIGNTFDKYHSANPIVRHLLGGFDRALMDLVRKTAASTIHEVGCGEGFWTTRFARMGLECRGTDFSQKVIAMARENAARFGLNMQLDTRSIYDLRADTDSAPLVVCCEVLEHLESPEQAVDCLAMVAKPNLIASVPREPLWRILNLARGKYIRAFGNTPGHFQHWSKNQFVHMLSRRFIIEEVRTPLPWTMVLCRVR